MAIIQRHSQKVAGGLEKKKKSHTLLRRSVVKVWGTIYLPAGRRASSQPDCPSLSAVATQTAAGVPLPVGGIVHRLTHTQQRGLTAAYSSYCVYILCGLSVADDVRPLPPCPLRFNGVLVGTERERYAV